MEPLDKPREEFKELIDKISLPESPVGIDAQYTHAVIIDYLKIIFERLGEIESQLGSK